MATCTSLTVIINQVLIPLLSQSKELKTLGLMDASSLDVDLNPQRCGNAYMWTKFSEGCRSKWRHVADMIFGACINLDIMGYRNFHS